MHVMTSCQNFLGENILLFSVNQSKSVLKAEKLHKVEMFVKTVKKLHLIIIIINCPHCHWKVATEFLLLVFSPNVVFKDAGSPIAITKFKISSIFLITSIFFLYLYLNSRFSTYIFNGSTFGIISRTDFFSVAPSEVASPPVDSKLKLELTWFIS